MHCQGEQLACSRISENTSLQADRDCCLRHGRASLHPAASSSSSGTCAVATRGGSQSLSVWNPETMGPSATDLLLGLDVRPRTLDRARRRRPDLPPPSLQYLLDRSAPPPAGPFDPPCGSSSPVRIPGSAGRIRPRRAQHIDPVVSHQRLRGACGHLSRRPDVCLLKCPRLQRIGFGKQIGVGWTWAERCLGDAGVLQLRRGVIPKATERTRSCPDKPKSRGPGSSPAIEAGSGVDPARVEPSRVVTARPGVAPFR